MLLEKLESLDSKYSFSVIYRPFSFNSKAKSRRSHKNLGVIYWIKESVDALVYDLTLIKLDNSAARERQEIAYSSIVCIELKIKKLDMRTTRANIFESCVWFFYVDPLPSVSKSIMCMFLSGTKIGFPQSQIPWVHDLVVGLILNYTFTDKLSYPLTPDLI